MLTRRHFLQSSGALAACCGMLPLRAMAGARPVKRGRALVVVFLRGGADGLNLVVPHGDEALRRHGDVRVTDGNRDTDCLDSEDCQLQIKDKDLPPDSLIFEVKESVAVTNLKYAKDLADNLKKINCGFVLDDFGSGANPFQLLEHINADYIRLDKSLMDDLADNPQNQEAIKKIAEQASERGKFTITQFVKDANSLSLLWGMGVNFIQGYFLQEPQPDMNYDFTGIAG